MPLDVLGVAAAGLRRPILCCACSVNQSAPSGPVTILEGFAAAVGIRYSVKPLLVPGTACAGLSRPTLCCWPGGAFSSTNQSAPSGPFVIPEGWLGRSGRTRRWRGPSTGPPELSAGRLVPQAASKRYFQHRHLCSSVTVIPPGPQYPGLTLKISPASGAKSNQIRGPSWLGSGRLHLPKTGQPESVENLRRKCRISQEMIDTLTVPHRRGPNCGVLETVKLQHNPDLARKQDLARRPFPGCSWPNRLWAIDCALRDNSCIRHTVTLQSWLTGSP